MTPSHPETDPREAVVRVDLLTVFPELKDRIIAAFGKAAWVDTPGISVHGSEDGSEDGGRLAMNHSGWAALPALLAEALEPVALYLIRLRADIRTDLAEARAEAERVKAERDEADRRAGAAERQHASGFDDRIKADHWKQERKAERGYHANVSFDRVWAETCALADRATAAEAENTRLTAQLAGAVEALKPLAEAAAHHEHTHDDACVIAIPGRPGRDQPRVGYLRRARAALADLTPTP